MVTHVSCSYQINLFELRCVSEAAFSSVLHLYNSGWPVSVWPAYLGGQENLLHLQVFVWKSTLLNFLDVSTTSTNNFVILGITCHTEQSHCHLHKSLHSMQMLGAAF